MLRYLCSTIHVYYYVQYGTGANHLQVLRLNEVDVDVGQFVAAGAVLARLHGDELSHVVVVDVEASEAVLLEQAQC